jgi:hypothetical protein
MSQTFSTDLIPIADRLDAWLSNARQICGDCRFEFPRRHLFHGSIERRNIAGLELSRFSSSPISFAKFPVLNANSVDRYSIVITQLQGVRCYSQDGAMAILNPGDSTLIDSGRSWSSNCAGECSRLYLRVPRWLMENRLRLIHLPLLPRISGASGLGVSLFRLATSLYQEAPVLTLEEGTSAIEAYLEILSACIGHPEPRGEHAGHCAELLSRVEQFMETHLSEPALNPTEIANDVLNAAGSNSAIRARQNATSQRSRFSGDSATLPTSAGLSRDNSGFLPAHSACATGTNHGTRKGRNERAVCQQR